MEYISQTTIVPAKKAPTQLDFVYNRPPVPAVAPGQALGYSLQFTRLTAMLLSAAEGSFCSLEVLDDTAEQASNGDVRVVQSKSALTANPVGDKAVALWKTLFNWSVLVARSHVNVEKTLFELYISKPAHGAIIDSFDAANSDKEAAAAVERARSAMWGDSPKFPLKPKLSKHIARYVNGFLGQAPSITTPLVKNLTLVCGSGSPHKDLEAIIRSHPVSAAKVGDIADHMCGWVKRQVDDRLEREMPAILSRDEFHNKYVAYCRRADRDSILKSFARQPTNEERLARLPDTFVRQLDLIELHFDEKLSAVSDFLMACADRTFWSQSGDVDESSFVELDDLLTRTWKNKERACGIEAKGKSSVERGVLLYTDCMGHAAPVQGMSPPPHFVPGCFHRLADNQEVGWHPSFRKLLKSDQVAEAV